MNGVVALLGSLMFGAMVLATKTHFRTDRVSSMMKAISLISLFGFVAFIYSVFFNELTPYRALLSAALMIVSAFIFAWAISSTRTARLHLAFSALTPQRIVRSGPYAFVRHPFYVSYVMFWMACTLASFNAASLGTLLVLATLYHRAARAEERDLLTSHLAEDYRGYLHTGPSTSSNLPGA